MVQPFSFAAASTGSASGTSIAAVAPVAGSCSSTPKLSLRQVNMWTAAAMASPDEASGIRGTVTVHPGGYMSLPPRLRQSILMAL